MEIIKTGMLPKKKKVELTCSYCGCVFRCEPHERQERIQRNELYYIAKCPTCLKECFKDGEE